MPSLMYIDVWQAIGLIGVGIYVVIYAGIACDRLSARRPVFYAGNLIAAVFVLFSAVVTFNAASVVLQVFYMAVSILGIYRHLGARRVERATVLVRVQEEGLPPSGDTWAQAAVVAERNCLSRSDLGAPNT